MPDDWIPYLGILVFARAKLVKLVMLMSRYFIGITPHDKVDDIVATEVLLDGKDGLEGNDELIACLYLRGGMQTVVAIVAVVLLIVLTKVVQKHLSATHRGLCVGCRLFQQLSTDVLFCNGFPLHELIEFLQVLIAVEGQTDAFATVTTGTPRLLIIALQRLRNVIVNHKAHIGLVDAHAKGDGSHNDVDLLHEEVVLRLRASGRVEASMIGSRLDIVGTQHFGQVFNLLARQAINDAALVFVLLDETHDVLVDVLGLWPYLIVKIGAVERALKLNGIDDAQVLLDVRAHLVGSRGRQRNDGSLAYLVDDGPYAPVLRSEVMAPLRNAMSLIDGIERNLTRL